MQLPALAPVVLVPVVEPPAPPELEELLVGPLPVPPAPETPVVDEAPVVAPPTLVFVAPAVVAVGEPSVLCVAVACPVVDVVETLLEALVLEVVELVGVPVEFVVLVAVVSESAGSPLQANAVQGMATSEPQTHQRERLVESHRGRCQLRLASFAIIGFPRRMVITLLHQCPCRNAVIALNAIEHGERKSMPRRGCQSCPGHLWTNEHQGSITAAAPPRRPAPFLLCWGEVRHSGRRDLATVRVED